MDAPPSLPTTFRFAGFEFDARSGELRSQGRDIHLQEQAGQVLLALLRSEGEMVSREDLKKILWPDKTFGDLEGGLNAAVRRLRQTLGDEGAEPRLIGTLPKHGYRLLVPVEKVEPKETVAKPIPAEPQVRIAAPRVGTRLAILATMALATLIAAGWLMFLRLRSPSFLVGTSPGETWADGTSGLAFVWIPAGTFLMGSPASERGRRTDELQHPVTISRGFWMGRYEVTQAQYLSVMGMNPSRFKDAGPQAPVECVDWNDAQAFLRKLNLQARGGTYRLPTEAEWEYACRAGTLGSTYGPMGAIAWNAYTSGLRTHPVGQKEPNAWGLHDMLGNICELCEDCYKDPYDTSLDTDPVGPPSNRYHAIRGGSWQSGTTQTRAAHRSSEMEFEIRYPLVGFRVVCLPPIGRP